MKRLTRSRPVIVLTVVCFLSALLGPPYLSASARAQSPSTSNGTSSAQSSVPDRLLIDVDAKNPDVSLAISDTDQHRLHQEVPSTGVTASERAQNLVQAIVLLPVGIVLAVPLVPTLIILDVTGSLKYTPNDYFKQAREYESEGDLDQALRNYQDAYLVNDQFEEAYWRSGLLHQKRGEHYRALEDFTQVLRLNDQHDSAYYRRAQVWLGLNLPDRAQKDLQNAQSLGDQTTYRKLQNKIQSRLSSFQPLQRKERDIQETLPEATKTTLRDLADTAIKQCELSSDIEPPTDSSTDDEEEESLGEALASLLLLPVGLAILPIYMVYMMGWNTWQTPAEHEMYHAQVDFRRGNISDTIEDMNQIANWTENRWDIYISRGYLWELKRQRYRAIADYSRALDISPAITDAYVLRARVKNQTSDKKGALHNYTRALHTKGKPRQIAGAYALRGNVWHDLGRYDSAISDYAKAFRTHSCIHASYLGVGRVLADFGDTRPALTNFDRAIKLAGRVGAPYFWKTKTLLDINQVEEARKTLNEAPEFYRQQERFQELKSRIESSSGTQGDTVSREQKQQSGTAKDLPPPESSRRPLGY